MVERHEARRGFNYTWLVRARVDSFFSARAPRLRLFDPAAFTVPFGSNNGGVNDRFGVGGRESSSAAFRRLSALQSMGHINHTWYAATSLRKRRKDLRCYQSQ